MITVLIMYHVRRIQRDKEPKCNIEKKVLLDGKFLGYRTETFVTGPEWSLRRKRVKEALKVFRENLNKISGERRKKCQGESPWSDHLKAAKLTQCVNENKQFGHIPGIRIGDSFLYRAELKIVGLHCQFLNGIDYVKLPNGKTLATSIVDSGRYANDVGPSHTLIYCGHGGNPIATGRSMVNDQKLEFGNLALKGSMEEKVPVRVIRKFQGKNSQDYKYVYDGLYVVDNFWQERGEFGKLIFKFLLKRIPGQLELNWGKFLN
ncbi:hypothetical protein SLA2020_159510 [Shorea laevis]